MGREGPKAWGIREGSVQGVSLIGWWEGRQQRGEQANKCPGGKAAASVSARIPVGRNGSRTGRARFHWTSNARERVVINWIIHGSSP